MGTVSVVQWQGTRLDRFWWLGFLELEMVDQWCNRCCRVTSHWTPEGPRLRAQCAQSTPRSWNAGWRKRSLGRTAKAVSSASTPLM
jgi:hypothetical protein